MKSGNLDLEWKCDGCRNTQGTLSDDTDLVSSPIRVLSTTFTIRSDNNDSTDDTATTAADITDNTDIPVSQNDSTIEDRTFDTTNRDFNRPVAALDTSLPDRPLDDDVPADTPVTYEVVESGTKRGGRKLVSSDGYTYTARVSEIPHILIN
jgi:hypothetical protein